MLRLAAGEGDGGEPVAVRHGPVAGDAEVGAQQVEEGVRPRRLAGHRGGSRPAANAASHCRWRRRQAGSSVSSGRTERRTVSTGGSAAPPRRRRRRRRATCAPAARAPTPGRRRCRRSPRPPPAGSHPRTTELGEQPPLRRSQEVDAPPDRVSHARVPVALGRAGGRRRVPAERAEVDERHGVPGEPKRPGRLDGEARLADATRPQQADHPRLDEGGDGASSSSCRPTKLVAGLSRPGCGWGATAPLLIRRG